LAFKSVVEEFADLKLVLTGSDHGNKNYILRTIKNLGLSESVIDLGFVKTEELKWIFLNSKGLVMPTFMGPTNMPLLEAGYLKCPVACSDLPGHREQLGEYGHYFNPHDPNDISRVIGIMIKGGNNDNNQKYLNIFNIDTALASIDDAFRDIYHIRSCWGDFDEIY
jgi:glycosyltransferase involved in cell wall biosynthesis